MSIIIILILIVSEMLQQQLNYSSLSGEMEKQEIRSYKWWILTGNYSVIV